MPLCYEVMKILNVRKLDLYNSHYILFQLTLIERESLGTPQEDIYRMTDTVWWLTEASEKSWFLIAPFQ